LLKAPEYRGEKPAKTAGFYFACNLRATGVQFRTNLGQNFGGVSTFAMISSLIGVTISSMILAASFCMVGIKWPYVSGVTLT
jgi:hypothetical protein